MTSYASAEGQSADRRLWSGLLLGPLAAGINTVVGFTVSHHACEASDKMTLYVVMVVDLLLCAAGILISNSTRGGLAAPGDPAGAQERRSFMLELAIGMCAFCALLTIAGTLAVILLHPCD